MTEEVASSRASEGSAVLLVDPSGRVLLQQRDDDVPPAGVGRWAIPGGGREGEETPRDTAVREFAEETTAELTRLRHFGTYRPGDDAWMRRFCLHLFVAEDDVAREAIEVLEGMDFQYWTPEEALRLPMNPVTGRLLEHVLESGLYRDACQRQATPDRWISIGALNRWGQVLLVTPGESGRPDRWALPGGAISPGRSPDRAAFDTFESLTGRMLDRLQFGHAYRRTGELALAPADRVHLYFDDPDLALEDLELPAGLGACYVGPDGLDDVLFAGATREILEHFFDSPRYRALFH